MAVTPKVLGQSNPAATTATALYTVPGSTNTICSTLVICNQGASTTYQIAVQVAGAALTAKQYISYNDTINSNKSIFLTLGISLAATDVINVYAGTANLSFSLFGEELT